MRAIREAIRQYTVDGSMGHLLDDAEQDGLSLSDFTVFEIEELMNLGEVRLAGPALPVPPHRAGTERAARRHHPG